MSARRGVATLCWVIVAVGLLLASQAVYGQQKVNVSRLKPGDRLEVKLGSEWKPATFVEKLNDRMIRVKRDDFSLPTGAFVEDIRLPSRSAKKAAAPTDENPFATEEERIAARKPRTWSDKDGKFKVEATMLRVDGDNVVIKRKDDKEISVPLARLSVADREYVESIDPSSAPVEATTTASRSARPDKAAPAPPEVPLTETYLGAADVVKMTTSEWSYEPDPAPHETALRSVRLGIKKFDTFEHLQRILLSPAENRAFIVSKWSHMDQKFNVQALDLQRGRPSGEGLFSTQVTPIAVSPDGKQILARSESFGSGKTAELRLYKRDGLKVTPEKAWIPYLHHGPVENGVHGPAYPRDAEVLWADFLGSDRVASLSRVGELAVWNTADLKPLYQAKLEEGAPVALSRGRRYLACAGNNSISILQVEDGKLVGTLPADGANRFAQVDFSLDGRKLALLTQNSRLRVWDLTNQELEREFPVSHVGGIPDGIRRELAWVADGYLLAGNHVIDVAHCRTVWTYDKLQAWRNPWLEQQGRVWFLTAEGGFSTPMLVSASVPPEDVVKKWANTPLEDSLIIRPGVEVAIDLRTNDEHTAEVRERIAESLSSRGIKVVDDSPIKLIGTIGPGEAKTIEYRRMFGRDRSTTQVTVQGSVATLSFEINGEKIWKFETQSGTPLFMHLKAGESIGEAAQNKAAIDSKIFERVWIPVTIARPDPDAASAHSDYPGA